MTKKEWLSFGHIDVSKSRSRLASRMIVQYLQNIGMPIEVGIDVAAHRLNLGFKLPDSGKSTAKLLFQLFEFLSVSHRFAKWPNDPSSATAATRRADCNRDGPPPFAAAHG
jgi:hypothetical protein